MVGHTSFPRAVLRFRDRYFVSALGVLSSGHFWQTCEKGQAPKQKNKKTTIEKKAFFNEIKKRPLQVWISSVLRMRERSVPGVF